MHQKFAKSKFKIALLCGGPSLERGISLNSARSILDHLENKKVEIIPIYFDAKKRPYHISKAQLYSNTPSDFDFKLQQTATQLRETSLVRLLKTVNISFLAMHGPFGEDGGIQNLLEKHGLPFVGSSSVSCKKVFDKFNANEFLKQHGFFTMPSILLKIYHQDHYFTLTKFFKEHNIRRAVVKPASGGSSIGVFSVSTVKDALKKAQLLFSKRMDTRVVVEPFVEGVEFTVIILENRFGIPIALPPTEIETDYTKHQLFDFRRKYLPTRQVSWHCPPRFSRAVIEKIQAQAEHLFVLFGMRDFSRFDGWVLPSGDIWFCDFNPISGMEQNSFLFQQASRVGMTHSDILRHIVEHACARYKVPLPPPIQTARESRKQVHIIMGGGNSERQVSLMSGTNVWLKLRHSKKYKPLPYLLDARGAVWRLPYHLCLNHTVEEIAEQCEQYQTIKAKLSEFEERARLRLCLSGEKNKEEFFEPYKLTMKKFIDNADFVFIALHGGDGENGTLQKMLSARNVKFNGPNERVSRLCIDKWNTSRYIDNLHKPGIRAMQGIIVKTNKLRVFNGADYKFFWKSTNKALGSNTLIVKPRADGCTTGVAHLFSSNDLQNYMQLVARRASFIPKFTFRGQRDIIEMPAAPPSELLFEKFIVTDSLHIRNNKLQYRRKTGLIEITIGVIEKEGKIQALNPSVTVVEGEVLTVEEKFQGGTGINITPPPGTIMRPEILRQVKKNIAALACTIGIRGYSRIDAFMDVRNGSLSIIEINTLPGLTPSTVFYHQGLAENPPIFPRQLIEMLIQNR